MDKVTDTYRTINQQVEGLYKEKGSKFLSFALPLEDEEVVKDFISAFKKDYHDARHHCYAYRIGKEEPFLFRMNDDGEPSGTAGKPIYGQILSFDLTNILIVVVRYFGGTLLGTSGLIQAYKGAAVSCLEQAKVVENLIYSNLQIRFPYEQMNNIMRIIKDEDIRIHKQLTELHCTMNLGIRKSRYEQVKARFINAERIELLDAQ